MNHLQLSATAATLCCAWTASAGFQLYFDQQSWAQQLPAFTALTFSEFEVGTLMTNQYSAYGVTFLGGDDYVDYCPEIYTQDGWGIDANANCHLAFASDQ